MHARRGPDGPAVPAGVKEAFDALDAASVRWCLLRDAGDASEVDLLAAPEDAERAERALEAVGFIRQRAWGYQPHRFFLRADEDGSTKLDLVTGLRFGPASVHVPGLSGVLDRRRRDGSLFRLAQGDEFWALLLHAMLDKPSVEERHRRSLLRLAADGRAAPPAGLFRSPAEAERIVDAVERDHWDELQAWAKRLLRRRPLAVLRRAVARHAGWRMPPLRRRGITVALLAPDGGGKTTIAGLLVRNFPIPVRSIYMGLYKNPRRLPPGIGLAARVALQWTRYLTALYHRRRGRVVLFDRYTDDAALPVPAVNGRRDRFRRRVLAGALPRPDLILVLDAPAEVLLKRKGEHEVQRLERDRRHYRSLAEGSPRAVLLDATRPPDVVARAAAARIWSALVAEA